MSERRMMRSAHKSVPRGARLREKANKIDSRNNDKPSKSAKPRGCVNTKVSGPQISLRRTSGGEFLESRPMLARMKYVTPTVIG